MDYSAANSGLWNVIIQLGYIACAILIANGLRNKVPFIKKSLMPVAVLAGFFLLVLKSLGIIHPDDQLLEIFVYHGIGLGFIAMSLRVVDKSVSKSDLAGLKSGAMIVSTYLIQGLVGLVITFILSVTLMPGLFRAAGMLLPMGFGQGPGQANNIGSSYESLGFVGGHNFGLSIAAAGYLVACTVGVVILNILRGKNKLRLSDREHSELDYSVGYFHDKNEIPVSDSIDKLSIQIAMVMAVYLFTYFGSWAITSGIAAVAPGLAATVNTLIWGFNFILGSAFAIVLRIVLEKAKNKGLIQRQYQNNYLLNRISGFFFDLMIVSGIAAINIEQMSGLWLAFILLVVAGAVVTGLHLKFLCARAYKGYVYEGFISMYGMLTGTIGSGVLLLREIDPELETPAANNLVIGSSYAIVLGAPMLIFVGLAAKSALLFWVTLGLCAIYYTALVLLITKLKRKEK